MSTPYEAYCERIVKEEGADPNKVDDLEYVLDHMEEREYQPYIDALSSYESYCEWIVEDEGADVDMIDDPDYVAAHMKEANHILRDGEVLNLGQLYETLKEEACLELGVFTKGKDVERMNLDGTVAVPVVDESEYLFLYEGEDKFKRALYKSKGNNVDDVVGFFELDHYGDDYDEDIVGPMLESFAGLKRLTEYYDGMDQMAGRKHQFVRKATESDLKKQDWEGDADVNWKKPTGGGI